ERLQHLGFGAGIYSEHGGVRSNGAALVLSRSPGGTCFCEGVILCGLQSKHQHSAGPRHLLLANLGRVATAAFALLVGATPDKWPGQRFAVVPWAEIYDHQRNQNPSDRRMAKPRE